MKKETRTRNSPSGGPRAAREAAADRSGEILRPAGRLRWRRGLSLLAFLTLLLFAYTPLLRTGLLARDVEVLVRAQDDTGGEPAVVDPRAPRLLERFSLRLSGRWIEEASAVTGAGRDAALLRVENLVLLLLGAGGLGWLTRRLLLPWLGNDQAGAAGRAAAALFALHPLAISAVATLEARGHLLALALGALASAFFLKGRQDRRFGWTVLAFLLSACASFASDAAVVLPLYFAGFEFVSSHRYRPVSRRLRTAVTTLVVFGAAVSPSSAFRTVSAGEGLPGVLTHGALAHLMRLEGWREQVAVAAEKLGLLVLPVNVAVLGITGPILAGAIFLVSMQPALVAARSAPRLWGKLLCYWFLALFVAELVHAHVRVGAADIAAAWVLLPSAAVMACGIGIASTALSGPRRPYVAWAVLTIYGVVSFGNAQPWRDAARAAEGLRAVLAEVRGGAGDGAILVVDPPVGRRGVDPVGGSLAYLDGEPLRVRGVRREHLRLLLRQPELDAWRGEVLTLLVPETRASSAGHGPEYRPIPLGRPTASEGPREWRALGSPELDLEPELELLFEARPGEVDSGGPSLGPLGWRPRNGPDDLTPSIEPVSVRTPEGPVAYYGLEDSLAWLLRGRVRKMWIESGDLQTSCKVLAAVPAFDPPVEPATLGDDWVFDVPDTTGIEPLDPLRTEADFHLDLVDLASDRARSYVLDRPPATGRLHARGAARFTREVARSGGGPLVWSLSYRVGGVCLLRSEGRLEE